MDSFATRRKYKLALFILIAGSLVELSRQEWGEEIRTRGCHGP